MYDKNKHKLNERDLNKISHFNKNYKNIILTCEDLKI